MTYDSDKAFKVIDEVVKEIITKLLPNFGGNISTGNTNHRNYNPTTPNQFPQNTAELRSKASNFNLKNSIYSLEKSKSQFIHYTSIENCINIINEGKIRLYSINHLQDPNEYKFLDKYFKNSHTADTLKIMQNMHCMSLCEYNDEDSEEFDLWRLYGRDGNGVGLIFEIDNSNLDHWESACIGKIDYNPDLNKIELLNERYIELIQSISDSFDTKTEEAFSLIKLLTKKPFYSSEKEVRIIKKATDENSYIDLEENKIDGYSLNYKKEISNYTSIYLNNLKDISAFYKEDEKENSADEFTFFQIIDEKKYSIEQAKLFRYPKISIKEIIIGYNLRNQEDIVRNLNKVIYDIQKREFGILRLPNNIIVKLSKFYNDFK